MKLLVVRTEDGVEVPLFIETDSEIEEICEFYGAKQVSIRPVTPSQKSMMEIMCAAGQEEWWRL